MVALAPTVETAWVVDAAARGFLAEAGRADDGVTAGLADGVTAGLEGAAARLGVWKPAARFGSAGVAGALPADTAGRARLGVATLAAALEVWEGAAALARASLLVSSNDLLAAAELGAAVAADAAAAAAAALAVAARRAVLLASTNALRAAALLLLLLLLLPPAAAAADVAAPRDEGAGLVAERGVGPTARVGAGLAAEEVVEAEEGALSSLRRVGVDVGGGRRRVDRAELGVGTEAAARAGTGERTGAGAGAGTGGEMETGTGTEAVAVAAGGAFA